MDDRRFDALARMLGQGASRRSILKGLLGIGGVGVSVLAARSGPSAVDARTAGARPTIPPPPPPAPTPTPTPVPPDPCAGYTTTCAIDGCCNGVCTSQGRCCPDGTTVCGEECCAVAAQCCDGECCPAGTECIGEPPGEEEVCCAIESLCRHDAETPCCAAGELCCDIDGCCAGLCYAGGLCCPSATICADTNGEICCQGDTPDCCLRDGVAICINRDAGQCCVDDECPDSPTTCHDGICSRETQTCGLSETINCDDGQQCCEGGDNVCCSEDGVCCDALCFETGECCADADCEDSNICTTDTCESNLCVNEPVANGPAPEGTGACCGGEPCDTACVCAGVNTLSDDCLPASYSDNFNAGAGAWVGIGTSGGVGTVPTGSGSFTRMGGYSPEFPGNGWQVSLDIYLDVSLATGSNDVRFDYTTAATTIDCDHRRDFVFSVGTDPTTAGQFLISASNNSPGWPGNPGRSPITINASGWYTFVHTFQNVGGVLQSTMTVSVTGGGVVGTWVLADPTDLIGTVVGGSRYAWFPVNQFASIQIDNSSRTTL